MGGAAVVTGGAGGIGRALLARLGADGFTPVSWDVAEAKAEAGAEAGAAVSFRVDVTDAAAVRDAAAGTVARAGPIRALVVNAGILGPVARAWEVPPDEVRRVIEVNLVSAFLTVSAVVPHMLANPGPDRGRIVVMSSVQAKEGTAMSGPYAASKAGLATLAKVLGKELAAEGILVNAVTPTVVRTAMEQAISAERRADLLARIPMGRFLDPDEVAEMVSWLCGPACTFSTGAVFDLSGGRSTY